MAIITFWLGGKGGEIVSYMSFGGALGSIVLAVVAIIYAFVCSINSQQNTGEMRRLIWEASRIMTEKAGVLSERAGSMEERAQIMIRMLQSPPRPTTKRPALPGQTFRMNTSDCSLVCLLMLYYLARCHEHGREVSLTDLNKAVYGEILSSYYRILDTFFEGVRDGLSCFLEPGSIEIKGAPRKVKSLPEGFIEYVTDEVHRRLKEDSGYPEAQMRFAEAIKRVDFLMSGGDITFRGFST